MSDHEEQLKAHQENSFVTLHEKIDALKESIKIFRNEPHKFDQKSYDKLASDLDEAEAECKTKCDTYIKHLEANVKQHREDIASGKSS